MAGPGDPCVGLVIGGLDSDGNPCSNGTTIDFPSGDPAPPASGGGADTVRIGTTITVDGRTLMWDGSQYMPVNANAPSPGPQPDPTTQAIGQRAQEILITSLLSGVPISPSDALRQAATEAAEATAPAPTGGGGAAPRPRFETIIHPSGDLIRINLDTGERTNLGNVAFPELSPEQLRQLQLNDTASTNEFLLQRDAAANQFTQQRDAAANQFTQARDAAQRQFEAQFLGQQQAFQGQESALGRALSIALANAGFADASAGRAFTGGENALDRALSQATSNAQLADSQLGRQFSSGENALDRALTASTFAASHGLNQNRFGLEVDETRFQRERSVQQDALNAARDLADLISLTDPAALPAFFAAGGNVASNAIASGADALSDNALLPAARILRSLQGAPDLTLPQFNPVPFGFEPQANPFLNASPAQVAFTPTPPVLQSPVSVNAAGLTTATPVSTFQPALQPLGAGGGGAGGAIDLLPDSTGTFAPSPATFGGLTPNQQERFQGLITGANPGFGTIDPNFVDVLSGAVDAGVIQMDPNSPLSGFQPNPDLVQSIGTAPNTTLTAGFGTEAGRIAAETTFNPDTLAALREIGLQGFAQGGRLSPGIGMVGDLPGRRTGAEEFIIDPTRDAMVVSRFGQPALFNALSQMGPERLVGGGTVDSPVTGNTITLSDGRIATVLPDGSFQISSTSFDPNFLTGETQIERSFSFTPEAGVQETTQPFQTVIQSPIPQPTTSGPLETFVQEELTRDTTGAGPTGESQFEQSFFAPFPTATNPTPTVTNTTPVNPIVQSPIPAPVPAPVVPPPVTAPPPTAGLPQLPVPAVPPANPTVNPSTGAPPPGTQVTLPPAAGLRSPLDNPFIDQVRQIRQDVDVTPPIRGGLFNVRFGMLPPSIQDRFLRALQARFGVPINDLLAEAARFRLQGVDPNTLALRR